MTQFLKIAHLDERGKAQVRRLEEMLARHVMAFEPGLDVASLTPEQLEAVQQVEEELGVTLLVYKQ